MLLFLMSVFKFLGKRLSVLFERYSGGTEVNGIPVFRRE
jgi:hypothetical protein